jgi:hypothetical protein
MKLRIRGNSLRLRLSTSDVQRLREAGRIEEAIRFEGGGTLRYELVTSLTGDRPGVRFDDGTIRVVLPGGLAEEWASTDRVGIESQIDLGEGETLGLLIEKDFRCLHRESGEDEAVRYPHPLAGE